MIKRLVKWFRKLIYPNKINFVLVKEFPVKINPGKVYIEGDINYDDFWFAKLKCPCGCGDVLTLNLINDTLPSWQYTYNTKTHCSSLKPSIRRIENCKSHFWIIQNRIKWF